MGGALAQTTGPAAQDSMKSNHNMSKDGMKTDGMKSNGTMTDASGADRATVPGSMTSGEDGGPWAEDI